MAEDTQIFKPEDKLTTGGKKAAFLLAVIIFVGATLVAISYERLIAPLNQGGRSIPSDFDFKKFDNSLDFLAHVYLSNRTDEVEISTIPTNESVLPEKSALTRDSDKIIIQDNLLIKIGADTAVATDANNNTEVWRFSLDNGAITSVRIIDSVLYLGSTSLLSDNPTCPIPLYRANSIAVSENCDNIYVNDKANTNTIHSIYLIEPANGNVSQHTSVLGGKDDTLVHIGESSIYVLQNIKTQNASVLYDFLTQEAISFLPAEIITNIQRLENYDISDNGKIAELENLIKEYYDTLPGASQEEFFSKYSTTLSKYLNEYGAFLGSTAVYEFDLDLNLKNTDLVNGYSTQPVHDYKNSLYFLTTATDGPTEYIAYSTLYKINGPNITKFTLNSYPDTLSFGANYMFTSTDEVLSSTNLESIAMSETNIEGEYLVAPFEDSYVLISPTEGTIQLSTQSTDNNISQQISENWSHIKTVKNSISYSDKMLFIPGEGSDYLVTSENLFVAVNGRSLFPQASYFGVDYLYVLGDNLYIMNSEDGTTIDELNVLY